MSLLELIVITMVNLHMGVRTGTLFTLISMLMIVSVKLRSRAMVTIFSVMYTYYGNIYV